MTTRYTVYDGEGAELEQLTLEQAEERYARVARRGQTITVSGWDESEGERANVLEVLSRAEVIAREEIAGRDARVIVEQAHRDDPAATLDELASAVVELWRRAQSDAAADRLAELAEGDA